MQHRGLMGQGDAASLPVLEAELCGVQRTWLVAVWRGILSGRATLSWGSRLQQARGAASTLPCCLHVTFLQGCGCWHRVWCWLGTCPETGGR